MKAVEWFFFDKAFQGFHAQGEFVQSKAALFIEGTFAQPLQPRRLGVFGAVSARACRFSQRPDMAVP
jgi:hypothetical protein